MPDSPPPIVMAHAQKPSDVGRWLARLLVDELHASKVHVRALDDAGSKLRLDALEPTAAQLVREAERVGLAKPALDPHMGHIAVSEASLHLLAGAHPPHALFSPCDRVMLAVSIARRPTFTAAHVAALPARASRRERAACVEGASICGACEAVGGVTLIAPHDQPRRAALQRQWLAPKAPATAVGVVRALTAQPHALIRAYFGPTEISFYFEFLGELSRALVGPAAAALVLAAVGAGANALLSAARAEVGRRALTAAYASGLIVWAAAFVEGWTRREKRRALESGTFTATDSDLAAAARAGFRGTELRHNPLTDSFEAHFPARHRAVRYAVTVPVTLCCLVVVGADMWLWLHAYYAAAARWTGGTAMHAVLQQLPTVGYCASVSALSAIYRPLAAALTERENYRTAEAHRNALVARRVLFELCNNYSTLFYLAFYNRDGDELRAYLLQLLVAFQVLFQLLEVGPASAARALRGWRARRAAARGGRGADAGGTASPDEATTAARALVADVVEQLALPAYDPFDDYLELTVQFGNVLLFATVLPIAPIFALCNNVQEIRADAHKVLTLSRRPAQPDTTRHVHGIGAWRGAFLAVTLVAAVTNVALLVFTLGWLRHLSPAARLVAFLAGEQLALCAVALVVLAQPRLPEDVATRLASAVLAQQRALLDMAAPVGAALRARHVAVCRVQARARGSLARIAFARARRAAGTIQTGARDFLKRRQQRAWAPRARARRGLGGAFLEAHEIAKRQAEARAPCLRTPRAALAGAAAAALLALLVVRPLGVRALLGSGL